jgi:general secretion pathway protein J
MSMARAAAAGFTLIEVLVAITLLAVLAMMAWRGLDMVISHRARLEAASADTEHVLRTLGQFERDVAQRAPDRLFKGRYGAGATLPLALSVASAGDGRDTLSIVRRQDGHPAHRVTYTLDGARITRDRWGQKVGPKQTPSSCSRVCAASRYGC